MLYLFIFAVASYSYYFAFFIAARLLCPEIKDYLVGVGGDDHALDAQAEVYTTSIMVHGKSETFKTRFIVPATPRATALLESYMEARHWAQYGGAGLVIAIILLLSFWPR